MGRLLQPVKRSAPGILPLSGIVNVRSPLAVRVVAASPREYRRHTTPQPVILRARPLASKRSPIRVMVVAVPPRDLRRHPVQQATMLRVPRRVIIYASSGTAFDTLGLWQGLSLGF